MGDCVAACSLTDMVTKAQMLQEQRDMLVLQLSLAEEEKVEATQAAAIASAEAQMQNKLYAMLEVCSHCVHTENSQKGKANIAPPISARLCCVQK